MSITTKQAIEGSKNLMEPQQEPDGKALDWLLEQRKNLSIKLKQLEAEIATIDEDIQPFLEAAVQAGEKTLGDYWQIVKGSKRFSYQAFKEGASKEEQEQVKKLSEIINSIKEPYKVEGKPYLKHPKL